MDFTRGTVRVAVAGVVLGAAVVGGAFGAMALSGGDSTPAPHVRTADVVASTEAAPSTVASTVPATVAPVTTLAPGFESYTPGAALPAAPPAPTPENPTVSTVPGPYGPIYPDGYTTDTGTAPPQPVPPVRPVGQN